MAFRCLLVLHLCTVGRIPRPDVNTLEQARKLLKSLWGAVETSNVAVLNGKGTPNDDQKDLRRLWFV